MQLVSQVHNRKVSVSVLGVSIMHISTISFIEFRNCSDSVVF